MLIRGRLLLDAARQPTPGWVRVEGGMIADMGEGDPPHGSQGERLGGEGRIICPGFIDAHIHLPQVESVGVDGPELLEWLRRAVFPAEEWWARGGAAHLTTIAVARMLRNGTTGFAGYLASDGESSAESARMLQSGAGLPGRMRFAVGRVAMDRNAPAALTRYDRERAETQPTPSVMLGGLTEESGPRRGEVSLNPRFAISCSDELLAEIGWRFNERARSQPPGPLIQTHLAESKAECEEVDRLFPDAPHYTAVYDRFGLLTRRTLLAHCVHLSEAEWALIRDRGCVVVHCPTANTFLRSGHFDLDAARAHGVRLALGSDVAGGPDFAMPRVARAMIDVAKSRAMAGATG
ncbi:MAG: amidohydrolase family protein, partial [Planctomycetota bacterium]|nr:amidohydrolase family protein [Planctomycetota bacterium]